MKSISTIALWAAIALSCAAHGHAAETTASTNPSVVTMTAGAGGQPSGASSAAAGHAPGSTAAQTSGWLASTNSFPQWLVIDLGAITDLQSFRQNFAQLDVWSYKIEGSNDNYDNDAYWTTLVDQTGGALGQDFSGALSGKFRFIRLYVTGAQSNAASSVGFSITGSRAAQTSASVPKPQPASTGTAMVGAQACTLWANKVDWATLNGYPDRASIMGTYNEAYDVSTDWQIKMAVEHGIKFMQPCWFRMAGNEGAPVVMASYDHLFNSLANSARYRNMMKFSINWVNEGPQIGTSSGVDDFVNNLVPYWINTYFNKPNYLKIDGKPVLAIYDFETFISQMGGLANAQKAIKSFRLAVLKAGYPGLILESQQSGPTTPADHWVQPGDPRGVDIKFGNYYTADYEHTNADAKAAGFDFMFAYHVPSFTDLMVSQTPDNAQVSAEQVQAWANWKQYSALPTIVSVSMGWNAAPWKENNMSWKLTPADWQKLLGQAKTAMAARTGLASKIVLLDNWNEYGEGHYIAPTKGNGYGYLDAVGAVFAQSWPAKVPSSIDTMPEISKIPQVD